MSSYRGRPIKGIPFIVQVLRVGASQLTSLLSDERLCFCGRVSYKELVDGTQVTGMGHTMLLWRCTRHVAGELVKRFTYPRHARWRCGTGAHRSGAPQYRSASPSLYVGHRCGNGGPAGNFSPAQWQPVLRWTKEARNRLLRTGQWSMFSPVLSHAPLLLRGRYSPTRLDTSEGSQFAP